MGDQSVNNGQIRPELELMLQLCRVQLTPAHLSRIEALLPLIEDWTPMVQTAMDNAVAPLVCHHLAHLKYHLIPGEIRDAARSHLHGNLTRNQRLLTELLAILSALKARGIRAAPFKGPMLAEWAYGNLGLRRFRDLDFLIRENDIDPTLEVLSDLGFNVTTDLTPAQDHAFRAYSGQYLFFHNEREVAIEPHWALAPHTLALNVDYDGLWERTGPARLGDTEVIGWSAEDVLLIVCIHGSKEMWVRLQWVCDVAETIRANPGLDWDLLFRRAREQGCKRMLNIGLLIAGNMLEAPLPKAVRRKIEGDRQAVRLAGQSIDAMFLPPGDGQSIYRIGGFRLAMRERHSDKLRYLLRTITTPRTQHFCILRLPDALLFLYVPLKLMHDYAALPLWRAGKWLFRIKRKPSR